MLLITTLKTQTRLSKLFRNLRSSTVKTTNDSTLEINNNLISWCSLSRAVLRTSNFCLTGRKKIRISKIYRTSPTRLGRKVITLNWWTEQRRKREFSAKMIKSLTICFWLHLRTQIMGWKKIRSHCANSEFWTQRKSQAHSKLLPRMWAIIHQQPSKRQLLWVRKAKC